MKFSRFIATLLIAYSSVNLAEDAEAQTYTIEEIKKLPIKQLRIMLSDRGLTCKGCSEKDEFVHMVFENQHLPKVAPKVQESSSSNSDSRNKEAEMEELMEKLKMSGMGAKMFSAKDFEGLSGEDIAKKMNMNDGSSKKRKGASSSSKKSKKESERNEDIEL